jgi:hypothetical protein
MVKEQGVQIFLNHRVLPVLVPNTMRKRKQKRGETLMMGFSRKGIFSIVIVLLFTLLVGCTWGGSSTYTASGKVIDDKGKALAGVKLIVTGGTSIPDATVKADGTFILSKLTKTCIITPHLEGYVFTPESATIKAATTKLQFIGAPIEEEDPKPITLESIAIKKPADKLVYFVGEELDITGLVIEGTYSDGSKKDVSISTYNVTGFDSSNAVAKQTLTVAVDERTVTYTIEIKEPVMVSAISVEPTELTLTVGDTGQITATVEPDNATNKDVTWESSDDTVATVDENGKVTAVAQGTSTITVTTSDGSHTATTEVTVPAESTVAMIGTTQYDSLQAAINAAIDKSTINILKDCTIVGATANNKDLTFVGNSSKPKVTFPQKGYQTYYGCEFTFENLTLECAPDENYQGIQPDKLIAKNCVINGKFWGYAKDLEFTDCVFNQNSSYNIWTYGSNVTFDNCEFNSAGRSVLIYNEGATLAVPAEIVFKNCTFSASTPVDKKAAIDIDTRFGSFNIEIENCSASGFSEVTESGGETIIPGFIHLKATDKGTLTVTVDGMQVY